MIVYSYRYQCKCINYIRCLIFKQPTLAVKCIGSPHKLLISRICCWKPVTGQMTTIWRLRLLPITTNLVPYMWIHNLHFAVKLATLIINPRAGIVYIMQVMLRFFVCSECVSKSTIPSIFSFYSWTMRIHNDFAFIANSILQIVCFNKMNDSSLFILEKTIKFKSLIHVTNFEMVKFHTCWDKTYEF